jgi:plasmid stabilization system protein ParE
LTGEYVLEWSEFAIADRDAIFDYIEADSPRAAVAIDNRISKRISGLAKYPRMGCSGLKQPTLQRIGSREGLYVFFASFTEPKIGRTLCPAIEFRSSKVIRWKLLVER